ncbi:unnamed protein product [Durusdinium trenchii]|uniref:Uncharacterized protein n=1 Tax=Durusdinium trenchii TaxID=1381693 RepID=A0ABP0S2A6_9DINO
MVFVMAAAPEVPALPPQAIQLSVLMLPLDEKKHKNIQSLEAPSVAWAHWPMRVASDASARWMKMRFILSVASSLASSCWRSLQRGLADGLGLGSEPGPARDLCSC